MFIWTAKVNRRKLYLVLAAAVIVCGAVLAALVVGGRGAQVSAAVSPKGIRTEEDRTAYLGAWGWQVSPEAVTVEELELPAEFGPEYTEYLALQSGQGFDLEKYAGKRVKRYTYAVLNYPMGEADVQAHLLLFRNTVVGGEVLGAQFLHGLEMPS